MELENKYPAFYFGGNAFLKCIKWLFACVQMVSGTGHYLYGGITKMLAGSVFAHLAQLLERSLRKK